MLKQAACRHYKADENITQVTKSRKPNKNTKTIQDAKITEST